MPINSISLKNFKCFKELDIELSKITLLTGANSSGKSSLIYGLLAILQTEQFPFYLSPNGKYVNMGSFEEISFKHNRKANIEISGEIRGRTIASFDIIPINFKTIWQEDSQNNLPQLRELKLKTKEFTIEIKKADNILFSCKFSSVGFYGEEKKELLSIENIKKVKNKSFTSNCIEFENAKFDTIDELFKATFFNRKIELFNRLQINTNYFFELFDQNFNFIGSFRDPPDRTYYQKPKSDTKIDLSGKGYIDQILEWEERNPEKLKELVSIMKELELVSEIKSRKMKGGRFEIMVKANQKSVLASLSDVGFGISQFLPVIVADLQLINDSLVAVSQPEIHLHPKVQALFGNYLVKQIKKQKKQYIIETHSEYLINRIRSLIVKGELAKKDLSVYYLENSGNGSKCHKIEFKKNGQILNAPKEFFDTYMIDVMDIALNA